MEMYFIPSLNPYTNLFQFVVALVLLLLLSNHLSSQQQLVVLLRQDPIHYRYRCQTFDANFFFEQKHNNKQIKFLGHLIMYTKQRKS